MSSTHDRKHKHSHHQSHKKHHKHHHKHHKRSKRTHINEDNERNEDLDLDEKILHQALVSIDSEVLDLSLNSSNDDEEEKAKKDETTGQLAISTLSNSPINTRPNLVIVSAKELGFISEDEDEEIEDPVIFNPPQQKPPCIHINIKGKFPESTEREEPKHIKPSGNVASNEQKIKQEEKKKSKKEKRRKRCRSDDSIKKRYHHHHDSDDSIKKRYQHKSHSRRHQRSRSRERRKRRRSYSRDRYRSHRRYSSSPDYSRKRRRSRSSSYHHRKRSKSQERKEATPPTSKPVPVVVTSKNEKLEQLTAFCQQLSKMEEDKQEETVLINEVNK